MRVLVAEDVDLQREVLRHAVEQLGHQCFAAADGLQAWDLFLTQEPDVVISDWMMPGLEGPDLCRRVREHERPAYTYFVLVTMLTDKQHALEGI